MSAQWYVSSEGQTLGPYTGEQLQQFAQEGRIIASTLLWAEGMTEWLLASQIPGVLPEQATPAPTAAPAWAPPGSRAGVSGGVATNSLAKPTFAGAAPTDAPYPHITVKPASFGLWAGTYVGGFIIMILGMIAAVVATHQNPDQVSSGQGLAGILVLLGIFSICFSGICYHIIIYRAWLCLSAGAPRTSAGTAVGLLFVPLYNLYWLFVAINGLPKDWNRIVNSYEDLRSAPRLNETTFLLFCIGSLVFAPLAVVVMFPVLSQLCKGINFFAYRKNLSTGNSPAGFGGIKFG